MSHANEHTVYMFGWGVYEGDKQRPVGSPGILGPVESPEATKEKVRNILTEGASEKMIEDATEALLNNPCIKLDNGKLVWGAQCWWGPEEQINKSIGTRKVVFIDVPS